MTSLELARRDTGVALIRWERDKALLKLTAHGILAGAVGWMSWWFVAFMAPGATVVGVLVAVGGASVFPIAYAAHLLEAYREVRARNQDLRTIRAIRPIVARFRGGEVIESGERAIIFQIQRELQRLVEHYTKKAEEWRQKGHTTNALAFDLNVFDCSDALKLLSQTAAKAEQAIRPQPVARVEIPPPPIAKPIAPRSALAQYSKELVKRNE